MSPKGKSAGACPALQDPGLQTHDVGLVVPIHIRGLHIGKNLHCCHRCHSCWSRSKSVADAVTYGCVWKCRYTSSCSNLTRKWWFTIEFGGSTVFRQTHMWVGRIEGFDHQQSGWKHRRAKVPCHHGISISLDIRHVGNHQPVVDIGYIPIIS